MHCTKMVEDSQIRIMSFAASVLIIISAHEDKKCETRNGNIVLPVSTFVVVKYFQLRNALRGGIVIL